MSVAHTMHDSRKMVTNNTKPVVNSTTLHLASIHIRSIGFVFHIVIVCSLIFFSVLQIDLDKGLNHWYKSLTGFNVFAVGFNALKRVCKFLLLSYERPLGHWPHSAYIFPITEYGNYSNSFFSIWLECHSTIFEYVSFRWYQLKKKKKETKKSNRKINQNLNFQWFANDHTN